MQTSHQSSQDEANVNKFRIKWCLSSYISLPAKLLLIQSRTFAPIRAPPGRFDNIEKVIENDACGVKHSVTWAFLTGITYRKYLIIVIIHECIVCHMSF